MEVNLLLLLLSALQLFVSFGLLNYSFPLLPLLRPLLPIAHSHLPQIIPHIVLPFYSWLSFGPVAYGFHLYMVLATLSLVILSTCPNQLSRLYFIYLTVFSLLIASSSSSSVLSLHSPFAFCVAPNILLNIFLSITNNFCLMFSVKTQHSDPYTATGLIRALYSFILVFLDISLLWSVFWFAKEARLSAAVLSFISSSIRLSSVTVVPSYLVYSKNKFEKLVHLVGFIIRMLY